MASFTGQRRGPSFASGWIKFALLGVLVTVLFQGAACEVEPTESQCRPYIEKALKEQHLEDERILEEAAHAEYISQQEETPPTDDSDSTEGVITNEGQEDGNDDEDDTEVKREDEDGGGDDDEGTQEDEEGTEAGEEEESDKDGVEVESREENEVKEEEGEVEEKEDTAEGDTAEDQEDEEKGEDRDDAEEGETDEKGVEKDNDDDDSMLDRAIDIDVQEITIDDKDDEEDEKTEQDEGDEEKKTDDDDDEADTQEDDQTEEETVDKADDDDDKGKPDEKEEEEEGVKTEEKGDEEETDEKEGEEEETDEKVEETEEKQEDDEKTEEKQEDDEKTEEKQDDDGDEKTEEKENDDEKTDEKEEETTEVKDEEEEDKKEQTDEEDDGKDEKDGEESEKQDVDETAEKEEAEDSKPEGAAESEVAEEAKEDGDQETPEEEELIKEVVIPDNLRPRDHIGKILKLEDSEIETILEKTIDTTLKSLKGLYDTAIKPLEMLYKYRDLSNRHFGDPEIFSKPLILFMGPWSGGKSSTINYLLDNEFSHTSLRTGAEPSPAYFNILMHGEQEEILDGTQLAADWTFSGLQKFGQSLLDRLKGIRLPNKLLEKVNIVEIPGILEIRKQVQRLFPFNDACQWFIDRADIIFLVYDPSKLDVGPETEAILDQLKGREYQTRIILNKADQVKPEELMRVQGTLIWNISPLMSSSEPPIMYSTSLWSLPYEAGAPTRLLLAQERAFLRDLREAIDKRVENKIASARRFAVRVRNHAKMVDCYLTTYYNHKSFFGNRKKISDDIIEYPQKYHIYEGLSTLTNISRYDLPDPDVYRDFFKINPLYEFKKLSETCTYFRGCPINQLDVAIAYDLPELVGKYKKEVEAAKEKLQKENS